MKNHSELMSRVLERTKSEQDTLRKMLQDEQNEALKGYASSLRRGLGLIEVDIAGRIQKYLTEVAMLEQLMSRWLWAHVASAFILITLVIVSTLMSYLVREQSGLLHLQGQMAAIINTLQIDRDQVWVPVERDKYYVEKNGQLYMMVSMPRGN